MSFNTCEIILTETDAVKYKSQMPMMNFALCFLAAVVVVACGNPGYGYKPMASAYMAFKALAYKATAYSPPAYSSPLTQ
ncbi:hypothetical protein DAPPUDRAFT_314956 [Daphnia pulex]|uniref:Uncharacterized protein n=1 Tax=Daphnia pulex TaxID=6669 RepID=E9G879_DAPPU|nr:hypothetical protein DAPPUDRAFT_314956 [Daphnia pulex]|eukprot:EFX84321.1 hypothetical protein DAPPUDRAFT_314956 [Daphnia pulex]